MTTVSVVIPTFARPESMRRCLGALSQQRLLPDEVIIVDDASPQPVTLPASTGELHVQVLRNASNRGPAFSRNRGVAAAAGDLIVFLDDDVMADPELVGWHVEAATHSPDQVTIGPLAAPGDWRPTPWNRWEAETLAVEYDRMKRGVYRPTWRQFFTGNASLSRARFDSTGGFDERFTRAEDIELGIRLMNSGATFAFEPRAIGWHYARRTRQSWRRIPREYAAFDRLIDELHPELAWIWVLGEEAATRNPLTRWAIAVTAATRCAGPAATAIIAAASGLHAASAHQMSNAALSVAFSIEYAAAAARETDNNSVAPILNADCRPGA